MSGLFGLLSVGQSAVNAQRASAAIVGRNIANADTQGYSRESVSLESEKLTAFIGGVNASDASRSSSAILSRRERETAASLGFSQSLLSTSSALETQMLGASNDLPRAITDLFAGFARLSASPQEPAVRQEVISLAGKVANAFQGASTQLQNATADADQSIQSISKEATRLAQEIAAANRAMATDKDPVLADKRDLAAKKLSELTGAQARIDPDGQMRVTLQGRTFVDGVRAASLVTSPSAALNNLSQLSLVDGAHQDIITEVGGQLGGTLHFRDVTASSLKASLDQLAFDLSTQINATHSANAGLDGVSGRPLFTPQATATGAAQGFSVAAGVLADERQLATAAVGAGPGSNTGALALASLSSQPLAGSNLRSFFDESLRAFSAVGETVVAAQGDVDVATTKSDILSAARDSLSGVSVEDEMNQLTILQHASAASLKFISTVNEMMDDLLRVL